MRKLTWIILLWLPVASFSQGSIGSLTGDESVFYAQTKQVNQFFLRFNGEEDVQGKRYYPGNPAYRDLKSRKKYMNMLFDNSSPVISSDAKFVFIDDALNKKNPAFLDFYSKGWFAEVAASFLYKKEKVNLILYLKIEKQHDGYKWVISNVFFDRFNSWFVHLNDSANLKYFIHPMSHELDFMNLHKAFREPENLDYYFEKEYQPDMTALFVMEMKDGNLSFQEVNNVKFHVFQVQNWYFELSWFNRNNVNSGWLISNLLRVNDKEKRDLMRNYTHIN
ncbi:MAG: hypothetical protein NT040_13895 [Bacteroidetes bacterium]|nr:hypothetical protein [Bacteroidota bacterium]